MFQKLTYNFEIALSAIIQNKLRSFLTSLGIIFGVASVITMMAIGTGAKQKILEQMQTLGTQNLIIQPILEKAEGGEDEGDVDSKTPNRWSPGLSMDDAQAILKVIPNVASVSPEIILDYNAIVPGRNVKAKLVGVGYAFFDPQGSQLMEGTPFTAEQVEMAAPVCIIGNKIRAKLFPNENPIGKQVKCGRTWLTIVGVAADRTTRTEIAGMSLRDFNLDIYVPIQTVLLRYKNRSKVTQKDIEKAAQERMDDDREGQASKETPNYHQLDQLVVTVTESRYVKPVAEVVQRMLFRRHNKKEDFSIIVPEVLLEQERQTNATFNYVLSAIASISLLVGGIGIMNIMLASVMERIKEIGVRLSLGATRRDIISQFLSEAVTLSITGGLLGIVLGMTAAWAVERYTAIPTIISPISIFLSFFVSVTIGLVFGIFPARKASMQDPVISLRHE